MVKKLSILILIFVLIAINVNAISLELKTTQYGPEKLFDGSISINKTGNYSINSFFIATTNSQTINITLKKWFDNSNLSYKIYAGYYDVDGGPWNSKQILAGNGSKLAGFNIPSTSKTIQDIKFTVTGVGDLKIDIGNDNKFEWQYNGAQTGWSDDIFPNGYDKNSVADSEVGITGANLFKRCENINLSFNGLFTSSKVRVNALVKKLANGADLNASIDTKECNLLETSLNANSFTKISCEVNLDSPQNKLYQFCLYSKSGNSTTTYYKLPKINEFFFITANIATYNTTLFGTVEINSTKVKTELQSLLTKCATSRCILPINFVLNTNGQINIDSILLRDKDLVDYNSLYDLKSAQDYLAINSLLKLQLLKFTELKTPSSKGNYNLKISFENENSNEIGYNVTDLPIPSISISSYNAGIGQEIKFSASNSRSISSKIIKYSWNFGDGEKATGENTVHSYSGAGNFTVTLTLEDENGLVNSDSVVIYIVSLDKSLPSLINLTFKQISTAENIFDSSKGDVLETYRLLNYDSLIRISMANLTNLQNQFNLISKSNDTNKESKYQSILDSINNIRKTVPLSLDITTEKFENAFPELEDIPSPEALNKDVKDPEKFKEFIYSFNANNIKISADIKKVNVLLISGNKSFILVKKTIVSSEKSLNVVENFNNNIKNLDEVQVIRPSNYKDNNDFNIIEFGNVNEIVYTTTAPGKTVAIVEYKESVCGDKICSLDEDKNSCPVDCKKKIPWKQYIIIAVIVLIGLFYINFYKGPGNFRDAGNWISVKLTRRRLFTNKQDLMKLSNYVRGVLIKGYREEQIRAVLIRKGWTIKQIDYSFKQAKGMQKFK